MENDHLGKIMTTFPIFIKDAEGQRARVDLLKLKRMLNQYNTHRHTFTSHGHTHIHTYMHMYTHIHTQYGWQYDFIWLLNTVMVYEGWNLLQG